MSKARTDAFHYLDRTAMHSTKGSRRGFLDNSGGENPARRLTPEQQRENAIKRVKNIEDALRTMPRERPEHRKLRAEKRRLELFAHGLRPKQTFPNLQSYFMEAAQELLQESMFRLVLERAKERCKRAREVAELTKEQTP